MLLWHRHDTEAALNDLPNFIPMPSDWLKEDKDLFKSGYEVTHYWKTWRNNILFRTMARTSPNIGT